jgi:hypothetical protein
MATSAAKAPRVWWLVACCALFPPLVHVVAAGTNAGAAVNNDVTVRRAYDRYMALPVRHPRASVIMFAPARASIKQKCDVQWNAFPISLCLRCAFPCPGTLPGALPPGFDLLHGQSQHRERLGNSAGRSPFRTAIHSRLRSNLSPTSKSCVARRSERCCRGKTYMHSAGLVPRWQVCPGRRSR